MRIIAACLGMLGLVAMVGCGNRPTVDPRGNVVLCDSRFAGPNCEGDLTVPGDLEVGGAINAPEGGDVGGVFVDENGNVEIPGDLTVGGSVTVGEGEEAVVIPPAPASDDNENGNSNDNGNDDDEPPIAGELQITLSSPLVGLAEEEGSPPADCPAFTVGDFGIKVKVKVEGGTDSFTLRFRNYYGSGTDLVGSEGEREFVFVFDAAVPTTECTSSQVRVTDAEGQVRNIFFYIRVH